ncbi:MAG: hypothetical protein AAGA75_15220 [Cyanobacteria bacterium P01_E01_bin.6]
MCIELADNTTVRLDLKKPTSRRNGVKEYSVWQKACDGQIQYLHTRGASFDGVRSPNRFSEGDRTFLIISSPF